MISILTKIFFKVGKFMSLPCVKFITFITSYLLFISMLVANGIQFDYDETNNLKFSETYPQFFDNFTNYFNSDLTYKFEVNDFYIRKNKPSKLDYAVCVWLIGLLFREIKKMIEHGANDYLLLWSNIISLVMIILFFVSYTLQFYTIYIVRQNMEKLIDPIFWSSIASLNKTDINQQIQVFKTFYWLNNGKN